MINGSILKVRFNMRATVLNQYATDQIDEAPDASEVVTGGHWEVVQDEDTGGIKRVWMEETAVAAPVQGERRSDFKSAALGASRYDIECMARGFPEVGFRSTANTETFYEGMYRPFEAIQMTYPARYILSRRQLITNIRTKSDTILWVEEDTGSPTVFEVQGITPTFDAFGKHIDNLTVLKRADVQ